MLCRRWAGCCDINRWGSRNGPHSGEIFGGWRQAGPALQVGEAGWGWEEAEARRRNSLSEGPEAPKGLLFSKRKKKAVYVEQGPGAQKFSVQYVCVLWCVSVTIQYSRPRTGTKLKWAMCGFSVACTPNSQLHPRTPGSACARKSQRSLLHGRTSSSSLLHACRRELWEEQVAVLLPLPFPARWPGGRVRMQEYPHGAGARDCFCEAGAVGSR